MSEAAKTILQQRIFIWGLVAVIVVLLVVIAVLVHDLKEIDMDSRIARGRKKQERMEQHPRRAFHGLSEASANAAIAFDEMARKLNGLAKGARDDE